MASTINGHKSFLLSVPKRFQQIDTKTIQQLIRRFRFAALFFWGYGACFHSSHETDNHCIHTLYAGGRTETLPRHPHVRMRAYTLQEAVSLFLW
mmetsp:Transcript_3923/g.4559  ORF Transcript_3923/g.4559 Transcript_3923/m.4559 type:complete len:94 (-) Transcript_3923:225-506(-)